MSKRIQGLIVAICCVLIFFGGILAGVSYQKYSATGDSIISFPLSRDLTGIDQALDYIRDNSIYYSSDKESALIQGAINGALKTLGDPYAAFFDPSTNIALQEELSGQYEGVGAQLSEKDGKVYIVSPFKDSPADKAGILSGDEIIKVDETSVDGKTVEEVAGLIRGKEGTSVTVTVLRSTKTLDFTVTRAKIQIPVTESKVISGTSIGYLALYNFDENSDTEFLNALQSLKQQNVKGLIIDLRGNPGGYLSAAKRIAENFVEKGTIIVQERDKTKEVSEIKSTRQPIVTGIPVVILVDGGSASASEILAGALKQDIGAKLVGEKTFGKGTVQEMKNMSDGSAFKVTIENWLLPDGTLIEGQGITPDVIVAASTDSSTDAQFNAAVDLIKTLMTNK